MEKIQIEAKQRDKVGKSASSQFRRDGLIPAIFYGVGDNLPLLIDKKEFRSALTGHAWSNMIFTLNLDGGAKKSLAIIKEMQSHPLSGDILHLDFFEISMNKKVQINVGIDFIGIPAGVKDDGGILSHQRRELKIECLPNQIPDEIKVDISNLEVGKSLHIRDIQVPEGIELKDDPGITITVVNKPKETDKEKETSTEEESAPETKTA